MRNFNSAKKEGETQGKEKIANTNREGKKKGKFGQERRKRGPSAEERKETRSSVTEKGKGASLSETEKEGR